MSLDTLSPASATRLPAAPAGAPALAGPAWLLIAAVLLLPLLAYYGTAASIVSIWNRSDTYAHGFLIVPISAR